MGENGYHIVVVLVDIISVISIDIIGLDEDVRTDLVSTVLIVEKSEKPDGNEIFIWDTVSTTVIVMDILSFKDVEID